MNKEKATEILRDYLITMVEGEHLDVADLEYVKFNSFIFDECAKEVSEALSYFVEEHFANWERSYVDEYVDFKKILRDMLREYVARNFEKSA